MSLIVRRDWKWTELALFWRPYRSHDCSVVKARSAESVEDRVVDFGTPQIYRAGNGSMIVFGSPSRLNTNDGPFDRLGDGRDCATV